MLVNGRNEFNEKSFQEICTLLERKEEVKVYIDCIGHTRNNREQETYRRALIEKYGHKIEIQITGPEHCISYNYKLRDE